MCGIAGILTPAGPADPAAVRRMCQTLVHRGPDDEGIYASGSIGLGIRRLSIIDLAGGHQPIHNEDQTVWVVCNGEIYNFPELRKELEARGHRFYTHSDVEVIVHLYEELGRECIQKLRGMFALALYDERHQRLLLARDRLGKKPLYFAEHGSQLLFASEIKALIAADPELAEVNPDAILQYFYFGYVPDPLSAFKRISKLPPGHVLEYDNAVRIRQYWDLPRFGTSETVSEQECLDELERRLEEAVRVRLISDVPLGALLSGGVDSSIVVALMARASSARVKTFSIGFREQRFDESQYARAVAERFSTNHQELIVQPDFEQALDLLTHSLEEPFGDSSMLPTYYVCRMARKHVTVALAGDGGDELFAGYDRYAIALNRDKFEVIPEWAGSLYRDHLHHKLPPSTYGRNLAWHASLNARERYLDDISYFPALGRERETFTADFLQTAAQLYDPLAQFRSHYDSAPASDHLSRIQYLDTKTYLPGDILTKVDRTSMACSLEVRAPLLDHEVAEFAASLPPHWKIRSRTQKYILKRLAERLGVPSDVVHRPKQGFQLPLETWFKGELKEGYCGLLLEPRTIQRGYFRREAVYGLIDEHVRGRRNRSGVLWQMLAFELWHRNFLESSSVATLAAEGSNKSATVPKA